MDPHYHEPVSPYQMLLNRTVALRRHAGELATRAEEAAEVARSKHGLALEMVEQAQEFEAAASKLSEHGVTIVNS